MKKFRKLFSKFLRRSRKIPIGIRTPIDYEAVRRLQLRTFRPERIENAEDF